MSWLPVIERELRATARHALTYALRLLAAVAALAVFLVIGLEDGYGTGGRLFAHLHATIFIAIWVLVPLLAADSISRERREGTLPLLFLTPLRPWDIVSAKGLAHGLRGLTLWLAALPILTIPFVGGGINWSEVALSLLLNGGSLCLALAAGVTASALSRSWARAQVAAAGLALAFWLVFIGTVSVSVASGQVGSWFSPEQPLLVRGFVLALNRGSIWQTMLGGFGLGSNPMLEAAAATCALSGLGSFLLLRFAAWRVGRAWGGGPLSPRVVWWQQRLFSPVVGKPLLRAWLRRSLERNPIGWLEQRSWSGRLVVWSWLAVVACLYSSLFTNLVLYERAFHSIQSLLATLLAAGMALGAAGSFRRERETGVLELLLVAPLRESQIIGGRVRGLYSQFLPAVCLLSAVWIYCAGFLVGNPAAELSSVLCALVTFATVPVVGLYFSLAKTTFIEAFLWTVLVQLIGPGVIARAAEVWLAPLRPPQVPPTVAESMEFDLLPAAIRLCFAVVLGLRLHANLQARRCVVPGRTA